MKTGILGLNSDMLEKIDESLLHTLKLAEMPETLIACYVDIGDDDTEQAAVTAAQAGWQAKAMPFGQILLTLPAGQLAHVFSAFNVRRIYDSQGEMRAHEQRR